MAEYAIILAAVAISVFVFYQTLGNTIGSMVNEIDPFLTNAS